jgi:hypothetical protein
MLFLLCGAGVLCVLLKMIQGSAAATPTTMQLHHRQSGIGRRLAATTNETVPTPVAVASNSTTIPSGTNSSSSSTAPTKNGTATTTTASNDGDFTELNNLVQDIVVRVPTVTAASEADVVTVTIKNTVCTNFKVRDVQLATKSVTPARTTLQLDVDGLDFLCDLQYYYTFLLTNRGTGKLESFGNRATLLIEINTPPIFPPPTGAGNATDNSTSSNSNGSSSPTEAASVMVQKCSPEVQITNLDLNGFISEVVVDTVTSLLRYKMQEEAQKFLCDNLEDLSTNLASSWLQAFTEGLAKYPPSVVNMLTSEGEASLPDEITFVDFQSKGIQTVRRWVNEILRELIAYATKPVEDPATGLVDLNANILLRKYLLNKEGAYPIQFAGDGIVFYKGEDRLTQTTVLLHEIKVFGLDTLTSLGAPKTIGQRTVQSDLSMDYIRAEMNFTVVVKPSTLDDSYIEDPTSSTVARESVTIKMGINNVKATASAFLLIDEDRLGALHLGSLLQTKMIQPCFLSTLSDMEVSGLTVEVNDIEPPTVQGLVSKGIDRVVSTLVETANQVYGKTLIEAMPGLLHVQVREYINTMLISKYLPTLDRNCVWDEDSVSATSFVDFRDLFLKPDEALALGGSGTQPYGDLIQKLVSKAKDNWLTLDSTGSLKINSVIRSLIEKQSNSLDQVLHLGNIFKSNSTVKMAGLRARAIIEVNDAKFRNLDSVRYPLEILNPINGSSNELNTSLSIGSQSKRLQFSANLRLAFFDGAGVNMNNELALNLESGPAFAALDLLVRILETPFFSVPIRDTLNVNCWIATSVPSTSESAGIELLYENFDVQSLFVNFTCTSCTSPDFETLLWDMYSPDRSGNITGKFSNVVDLVKQSIFVNGLNQDIVKFAAKQCPHSPEYDPEASYSSLFMSGSAGNVFVHPPRDRRANFFNIANAVLAVCLAVVHVIVKRAIYKRHRTWRNSLSESNLQYVQQLEDKERQKEASLNSSTTSMYRSSILKRRVRIGFPIVLSLTVALQLCGHLAVLNSINLSGQIAGEPFFVRNFLQFRFFRAVPGAAKNGGYEMAFFAFLFTGVWPYVKLFTSLALWFMPTKRITVSKRGTILLWLDVFAALSVVDIATTLFAVGALLVYFGGLDQSLLTDEKSFVVRHAR